MTGTGTHSQEPGWEIPNGPAAAAMLAAGIGSAALGIAAFIGDVLPAARPYLNFYNPSGPESGVTTIAVAVWLLAWFLLNLRWRNKIVAFGRINLFALIGLAIGLLFTFPPFMDLLQGQ